jgi:hypothetical protein
MKLALEALQENAGPDQRVTARADILGEGIAHPHLTGVWDAWEIRATAPPQPADYERPAKDAKFRGWLVSNPDPAATRQVSFASLPPVAPALLWGRGTLGESVPASRLVSANKVPVVSPNGAYAWAVLDEGVKVRINTPFADGAASVAAKTRQLGSGERPATEFLPGLGDLDREFFRVGSAPFEAMVAGIGDANFGATVEMLAPGGGEALKALTHDVSLHAMGLFTDTARGGLRQDFQLLMNASTLPTAYRYGTVYANRLGLSDLSAPNWTSLQQFARLYRTKVTDSAGVPVIGLTTPVTWSAATINQFSPPTINRSPPPGQLILPTIAKVQMLFSLVARPIYGPWLGQYAGYATHFLYLTYTPIITLHNPYNVALECSDLRFDFADVPFAARVFRNDQPMSTHLIPLNQMTVSSQSSGQSKKFGMNLRSGPPPTGSTTIRFQPGEVKVFSLYLDPTQTFGSNPDFGPIHDWRGTGLSENMIGVPGIQPAVGFSISWWVTSSRSTQYHDHPQYGLIALNGTDNVKVEFAPLSDANVSYNRFVVTMTSGTGSAKAAIEVNYENTGGLQEFLLGKNGTLAMTDAVSAASIAEANDTPLGSYTRVKPFALFTLRAKTTAGGRHQTKPWCFDSGIIGASSQKLLTEHPAHHSHEIEFQRVDGGLGDPTLATDSQIHGYFISGNEPVTGRSFGLQYDIPLAPIQTLASLNGANPGGSSGYLPRFAQPIGNSWALPLISANKLVEANTSSGYNYLDHSFLLNLALYDGFFCSGLADQTGPFGTGKTAAALATDFAAGQPLDDPRLQLYRPDGRVAADFPGLATTTTAYTDIAAWLMIKGSFNINSTSVPAWKAMLASIHDAQALGTRIDPTTNTATLGELPPTTGRISRFRLPAVISGGNAGAEYWLGPRAFSDADLQTLAENIVSQIRLRGPFLSLAEFVNRRLGTGDTAQRGALQQAIDDSNLNPANPAAGTEITAATVADYEYANPTAGTGPSYQGAPGFLTQADLLNVLGNAASARSDTFTIRCYGEADDDSGTLLASAVCEAVVQRLPDWVDPADQATTAPAALTSETNKLMGRRFRVLAFRWLKPDEI